MNAEIFSEWIHRQGYQVTRTQSSYWYTAGPRVLQAFPYHWIIQPSPSELKDLMWKKGVISLRYSAPLDSPVGMVSYHVVLTKPYHLEMLRPQARNGVRKGLTRFNIEPVPLERLAEEGWNLQRDTLERQERVGSMDRAKWQKLCRAGVGLPGIEAWAAIAHGQMAGAVLIIRVEDTICVPFAMSHRDYLREHVNNALFYSICSQMLEREGINGMFFCLHSLDAPESVDEFKFRMSLIAKPVRQVVDFHPVVAPLINPLTQSLAERLARRYPDRYFLTKAAGMLRFYLRGKRPIVKQEWPECLSALRSEMTDYQHYRREMGQVK